VTDLAVMLVLVAAVLGLAALAWVCDAVRP
jgi:hypothetical protein